MASLGSFTVTTFTVRAEKPAAVPGVTMYGKVLIGRTFVGTILEGREALPEA
jgi:hypothetical protein